MSKARVNLASKVSIFFKTALFFARSIHVGTRQETSQSPVLLPAARQTQRVNDEPVKDLNLLLFVNFIW